MQISLPWIKLKGSACANCTSGKLESTLRVSTGKLSSTELSSISWIYTVEKRFKFFFYVFKRGIPVGDIHGNTQLTILMCDLPTRMNQNYQPKISKYLPKWRLPWYFDSIQRIVAENYGIKRSLDKSFYSFILCQSCNTGSEINREILFLHNIRDGGSGC